MKKYDVFISYSHYDEAIVSQFQEKLESLGYRVWRDKAGIKPTVPYKKELVQAIKDSRCMAFFSSEAASASSATASEIGIAKKYKVPIVPVKLDNADYNEEVEFDLVNIDHIDYSVPEARPEQMGRFISHIQSKYPLLHLPESDNHHKDGEYSTMISEKHRPKIWIWTFLAFSIIGAVLILVNMMHRKGESVSQSPSLTDAVTSITQQISTEPSFAQKTWTTLDDNNTIVPGRLKVSSTPFGATIWLDGNRTDMTTPMIIEDLSPGKHIIKLSLEGYNDYSESVAIVSSKQIEISKILIEDKPIGSQLPNDTSTPFENTSPDEKMTAGTLNGYDWVDLGLSVKWATCNVGASSPEDYGSYFAWGETTTKSIYSLDNEYKFYLIGGGMNPRFKKYIKSPNNVINMSRLDMVDDAARQSWGGNWRMPTEAELTEMREKCIWLWTAQGGNRGYRITSKTNGNSIFFPAAGYRSGSIPCLVGDSCCYWSSDRATSGLDDSYAYALIFNSEGVEKKLHSRWEGLSVRPVTE